MPDPYKNILFLPAWYPNKTHLSIGSFVRSHAEAMQTKAQVHVLYVCGEEGMKGVYRLEKSIVNGVRTYILYYKKPRSKNLISQLIKAFLYVFGQFYGYYLYRKENAKPTIFHVHVLTRAAILPFVMGFFTKVNYFITEHWSRYLPQDNSYHGFFRKAITKQIVNRSQGVSTVSKDLKYNMNRHGLNHKNFKVISNVVDDCFFESNNTSVSSEYFVHVSNFAANCKNVTGILSAFKMLQDSGHGFSLKMVGDGDELEIAKDFVATSGLANVEFTGFLYGQQVVDVMQGAKALILFSHYENQPVVILESLSLGLPVIATSVGGILELIDDSSGLLVNANDTLQLSEAIRKMIDNEIVFDRNEIKKQASLKYKAAIIADEFLVFYKDGGLDLAQKK